MFFRNSPQAVDIQKTDKIGPHEVIAYIEEQKNVTAELDGRITDHKGQIMADQPHLHETWEITGRDEFNLDTAKVFKYQGSLDESGRIISRK